jgi:hypothetical protein
MSKKILSTIGRFLAIIPSILRFSAICCRIAHQLQSSAETQKKDRSKTSDPF